jgi:hypothetical protein
MHMHARVHFPATPLPSCFLKLEITSAIEPYSVNHVSTFNMALADAGVSLNTTEEYFSAFRLL